MADNTRVPEAESPVLVVAEFDAPDDARAAVLDLERRGFDADDVGVTGRAVPTQEETHAADVAATSEVGKRYAGGAAVGALIGAAVLAAIVLALGVTPRGAAVVGALVAGACAGFVLGGFLAAARRLPVNEESFDTYTVGRDDPEPIVVRVRAAGDDAVNDAEEVFHGHRARRVDKQPL